ncbi:MAG: HEAT repeat domain-containing protein [Gemmataceae bacterium]|nr:HEAT repeat domain-containing protein [Gemmata sp.]MDW8196233.1 HEAT repeat domain-containing protein [Gemmataceae bacterium]
MKRFLQGVLFVGGVVVASCGKPAPEEPPPSPAPPSASAATTAAERTKYLNALKSPKHATRQAAIEELAWLAETDPEVLPALVELLKDQQTAGPGRTLPHQINSTREAAARAILRCTDGEKVMKDRGLAILRNELKDTSAVIREHTLYTISLLGNLAQPLAADVQKLCSDPDPHVRGLAFDTLRVVGVADPVALAELLLHEEEDIVRLAAQLIPEVATMPAAAVAPLAKALASNNSNIQAAAAEGLARAGPLAAPATPQLVAAITQAYPEKFDPRTASLFGPQRTFWKALAHIGEAAVAPTAQLLDHTNPLVRMLAARTLGDIGPPAQTAKDALKKALSDTFVEVAVEAAVTLDSLGAFPDDVVDLMKRALDTPNGGVAATAIEGLPRMGAAKESLIPLALAKMDDANPNTRAAAVWLVGQIPLATATKAATALAPRLTDTEPEIRRLAGYVLVQLGPAGAAAAEALGQALATEEESDIRAVFIDALITMEAAAQPAVAALLPLLADPQLTVTQRAQIAQALARADPASPAVAKALVKAATDAEPTLRAAAAEALGRLNPLPAEAVATLVKLAQSDRHTGPRAAAIRALATAGPRAKAAHAEVDALTTSQQPGMSLWAQAARAAIAGDISRAAPTIRAGLTDRNTATRTAAAEILLLLGPTPADQPVLLQLLRDPNTATRTAAAKALARLGPAAREAVPQLRRLLDDADAEQRIAAAEALGQIGAAARPALTRLTELRDDPLVGRAARRAIEQIERPKKK